MDKSRVEPTFFFIEKILFSLKLFSGYFYGQSFIKTVRGPFFLQCNMLALLYNFTSVYTNIPSCRWDESKTSFRLLEEYLYIYEYLYNKILVS